MGLTASGLRRPPALARGDRVAVIAPASPVDPGQLAGGMAVLRALGFDPVASEPVLARDGYLAGEASRRAAAWRDAWDDPAVHAIFAARGGYGSVHLLEQLDLEQCRRAPKIVVGYSDVTTLLVALAGRAGVVCFHGPMVAGQIAQGPASFDLDGFERVLMQPEAAGAIGDGQVEVVRRGTAAGPLYGGTLSVLAATLGTPWAFDPPVGSVLFLEDVNERPYRIDRWLTQLRLAGVLERAVALVFGPMVGCDEPGAIGSAREAVDRVTEGFGGPILYGFPAGHTPAGRLAVTLPIGVTVRVVAGSAARFLVEEAAVEARAESPA